MDDDSGDERNDELMCVMRLDESDRYSLSACSERSGVALLYSRG